MAADRELALSIRDTVLPQRQQVLALTLQQSNGMLRGAYDLLTAKANEAAAERSYIEAWRDYWIARADLERAVGGRLRASSCRASMSGAENQARPNGSFLRSFRVPFPVASTNWIRRAMFAFFSVGRSSTSH